MITVASVSEMGGACPWQLSGLTDDGQHVYARYRGGRVAVYVGTDYPIPAHRVFALAWGHPLDGSLNGATLAALTKDLIVWPESVAQDGEVIEP